MNVFISHSWSYSEHYDRLAGWIFDETWLTNQNQRVRFLNTSVPKDNPIHYTENTAALRDAIYQRISSSHVLVIPTGMYASYSTWIKKELDGANEFRKPILAVDPWGQQRSSSVVSGAARETVGWNKQSIINSVWRLGNESYR